MFLGERCLATINGWRIGFPPFACVDAGQTKRRSDRADGVTKHDKPSQGLRRMAFTSPPPIENHLIHLLAQGIHVGIGKTRVQRADAVGVVAGAADGIAQLG